MNVNIKKVAVIGAGTMGAGIAAHVAGAGIPVVLLDIVPKELTEEDVTKGLTKENLEFKNKFAEMGIRNVSNSKTGVIYDPDFAALIEAGNLEEDLAKLSDCDWIIEVIVENLKVKRNLLKKIAPYCRENTIVSSNTSGVSITEIAEKMPYVFRKRFLGTHFFNPPRYMRLLELVPGRDTDPQVMDFMKQFGSRRLGKGVVIAKDTPNFIGNRIGCYSTMQTIRLMEKYQLDIEEMDQITGTIMGRPKSATFGTLDMVGLDVFYHVSNNLVQNNYIGTEEKSQLEFPQSIREMYENGQLGLKTGQGFYKKTKTKKGKIKLVWDFKNKEYVQVQEKKVELVERAKQEKSVKDRLQSLVYSEGKESQCAWELIKNLLIYSAYRVPEITERYEEIDNAMHWGYNWQIGPFELWDIIGFEKSVERMKKEGETIPKWIDEKFRKGQMIFYDPAKLSKGLSAHYRVIKSYDDANLLDMGDGVVCVELNSRVSSITIPFIKSLQTILREAEEDSECRGLVIANGAPNFSIGADLSMFKSIISEHNWERALEAIAYFHDTSMMLKYAKKPVVAAVQGMVLGGGLEFVMHCQRVLAHAETYMGLVEVGVGIIPGGGGVKELLLRNMERTEGLGITDYSPIVRKTWETIATAKVSTNAFDARRIGFMRDGDRIIMNIDDLLEESKKEVLRLSEDGFRQPIKKKVKVAGTSGRAYLEYIVEMIKSGNMISEYDSVMARELAFVVTGGDVPKGTYLFEEELLNLETEAVYKLIQNEKTQDRINHMLRAGRPLRN